jgi:hypothetical protein
MMGTSGNGGSGEARKYAAMDFPKVGARNKSGGHPDVFADIPRRMYTCTATDIRVQDMHFMA